MWLPVPSSEAPWKLGAEIPRTDSVRDTHLEAIRQHSYGYGLSSQSTRVQILALSPTNHMLLGKWLSHAVPQFLHLFYGNDNTSYLRGWLRGYKHLRHCLLQSVLLISSPFLMTPHTSKTKSHSILG